MVTIIEGLDGVGKTTICKEICRQIPSLIYIKESYTNDNLEKEKRVRLMLERIMSDNDFLYDRTTLIDDFVYNFLNESESSLTKYKNIVLVLLSHCQILHLCLNEQIRRKRFEERGDKYITNNMMNDVKQAYNNFYTNLNNVEFINLSGVLNKDVKKIVRRIKKMTKISHIVSSDLLDLIDGRDFYMCLANIASKDENYCNFYAEQVKKGAFVLLDNGCAEHDQMTLDVMWSVIEKINPSEVILNDCLMDGAETIRRSLEAIDFYKEKGYKGQFMFVPQGKDLREWVLCYELMDKKDISTIGVSKFVTSGWNDSEARHKCCEHLSNYLESFPVHLLGCHENINEVAEISKDFDFIRSNDTAIAYIYALSNQKINEGNRPSGEINFIKSELTPNQIELLKENIKIFDNLFIETK